MPSCVQLCFLLRRPVSISESPRSSRSTNAAEKKEEAGGKDVESFSILTVIGADTMGGVEADSTAFLVQRDKRLRQRLGRHEGIGCLTAPKMSAVTRHSSMDRPSGCVRRPGTAVANEHRPVAAHPPNETRPGTKRINTQVCESRKSGTRRAVGVVVSMIHHLQRKPQRAPSSIATCMTDREGRFSWLWVCCVAPRVKSLTRA